jgi:hypothetical protein
MGALSMMPMRGIFVTDCCARAASGQAAAPPSRVMKARRPLIVPPDPEAREFRRQTVRWPITSRAIQISKHAPMNPAIR